MRGILDSRRSSRTTVWTAVDLNAVESTKSSGKEGHSLLRRTHKRFVVSAGIHSHDKITQMGTRSVWTVHEAKTPIRNGFQKIG